MFEETARQKPTGRYEHHQSFYLHLFCPALHQKPYTLRHSTAGGGLDASLVAAQQRLKRSQLEDMLSQRLEQRPNVEELQEARILVFSETVEVLPTFRKSEYNRKPDNNVTFKKLTPQLKVAIREELNTFKKHEMPVHEESEFRMRCLCSR